MGLVTIFAQGLVKEVGMDQVGIEVDGVFEFASGRNDFDVRNLALEHFAKLFKVEVSGETFSAAHIEVHVEQFSHNPSPVLL
jgi:hypothetical protein